MLQTNKVRKLQTQWTKNNTSTAEQLYYTVTQKTRTPMLNMTQLHQITTFTNYFCRFFIFVQFLTDYGS